MTRKGRTYKVTAIRLADPDPELVSLVRHGANRAPFRVVKSEEAVTNSHQYNNMKDTKVQKKDLPEGQFSRITFKSSAFPSEADVSTWLTARDFTEFTVEKSEDGDFFVDGVDSEGLSDVRTVELDGGVSVVVGKGENATQPGTDPAANTDTSASEVSGPISECIRKLDYYYAENSKGTKISEILEDGQEAFPVGYWELSAAFTIALRKALEVKDFTRVSAVCAEFATMLTSLVKVFDVVAKEDLASFLTPKQEEVAATAHKADSSRDVLAGISTLAGGLTDLNALVTALKSDIASIGTKLASVDERATSADTRIAKMEKTRLVRKSVVTGDPGTVDGDTHGQDRESSRKQDAMNVRLQGDTLGRMRKSHEWPDA